MIDEKRDPIDEPEKKKRSKWMTAGIVLLILIGIPLLLAGTCMLIIRLTN
ncbi:MAG: hypothetical protein ACYCYM_05820 [Saccharofermentanales bacterium]